MAAHASVSTDHDNTVGEINDHMEDVHHENVTTEEKLDSAVSALRI